MAVTLVSVREVLNGVGGETFFDVPNMQIIQGEDVVVYEQDTTDDSIRNSGLPLVLNTNYTIVLSAPNDLPSLFRLNLDATTYPTGLPANTRFIVVRRTEMTQDETFAQGDPFPEDVLELVLDKSTLIAQEAQELVGRPQDSQSPRALVANLSDNDAALDMELPPKATRASQYLAFDTDGNPIAAAAPAGTTLVDAFWAPILQLSTKQTSLTALGITMDTVNPSGSGDFTGELWLNTTTRILYMWNGSAWEGLDFRAAAAAEASRPALASDFGFGLWYSTDTIQLWFSNASAWTELLPARAAANANHVLGADATGLVFEFKDTQTTKLALPRGFLEDITMSVGTDAAHDTDIGVGECRDAVDTYNILIASSISKQIDVNWAAGGTPGTPAGGIASSLGGVASGTWYHVFVIANPTTGAVDAGYDTDLAAVNLLADATGFTKYRRVGSVRTDGSANILPYTQQGNEFLWDDPVLDVNAVGFTTTAQVPTMTVPSGVKIHHIGDWGANETGTASQSSGVLVTALDQNDTAATVGIFATVSLWNGAANANTSSSRVVTRTNLNSQVRWRASHTDAAYTLSCVTHGWLDTRGAT